MSVAVLLNASAGNGRWRGSVPAILNALSEHLTIDVWEGITDAAEARSACEDAVARGLDGLVVVGGDGTFHTAVQVLAGTRVPVGLVPAGTCNDLADALGLPQDPVEAARAVAKAMAGENLSSVDAARVDYPSGQRIWFSSVLVAGYAASVAQRGSSLGWPAGQRKYDLAAVLEAPRFRTRIFDVHLDGVRARLPAVLFAVGNTPRFGGKLYVCPEAELDDGSLDVTTQGPNTVPATVGTVMRLFNGARSETDTSTRRFSVRSVALRTPGLTVYADGEAFPPPPFTVTCETGALVMPKVA
jgi:diacylglycerol kinase (ATP)